MYGESGTPPEGPPLPPASWQDPDHIGPGALKPGRPWNFWGTHRTHPPTGAREPGASTRLEEWHLAAGKAHRATRPPTPAGTRPPSSFASTRARPAWGARTQKGPGGLGNYGAGATGGRQRRRLRHDKGVKVGRRAALTSLTIPTRQ